MASKHRRNLARRRRQLADVQAAAPVDTPLGIIGFGGSMFPWEWVWATPHEYNPDLMGRRAQDTYMRMMNDAQIRGIACLLSLPIRQARWRMQPGGDTTLDQQIADFIEEQLFASMETSWDNVLSQMDAAELNGYTIHEIELIERGGQVCLGGLWDILPNTVEKVLYRPDRRLDGIWQWGVDCNGVSRREMIEARRLLFTISGGRGGSAAGEPKLRAIYTEWFIKHPLLRLMTVGLENSLIGTVWAKVPRSMSKEDREKLRKAIEDLRVRDATGFVLDADVILDILEGKRNAMDALPFIEYLDTKMTMPFNEQFIQLGTQSSGGGSRAVSEDHSRMFLMGRNAEADLIEGNLNRNLIQRLVDLNWPGYGVYPLVKHDDITRIYNVAGVGDALNKIATAGLLNWTDDVENTIRDWYNFDPLPEDFTPPKREVSGSVMPGATVPGSAVPGPAVPGSAAIPGGLPAVSPTPAASEPPLQQHEPGCACAVHQLTDQIAPVFAQVGDAFQQQAGQILNGMISHLETGLRELLHELGPHDPLAQAQTYSKLAALDLPDRQPLRVALQQYFTALTSAARQAASEVQGQPAPALSEGLQHWLSAQVDALTNRLPDRLRTDFLQSVLSGSVAQVSPAQLVGDAGQAARDGLMVEFRQSFLEAEAGLRLHLENSVLGAQEEVRP